MPRVLLMSRYPSSAVVHQPAGRRHDIRAGAGRWTMVAAAAVDTPTNYDAVHAHAATISRNRIGTGTGLYHQNTALNTAIAVAQVAR